MNKKNKLNKITESKKAHDIRVDSVNVFFLLIEFATEKVYFIYFFKEKSRKILCRNTWILHYKNSVLKELYIYYALCR